MSYNERIIAIIERSKLNDEYYNGNISSSMSEMDIEINYIIDDFLLNSKESKKSFCNELALESAWLLLNYAMNMAVYSLRSSDQRFFTNGLTALGIVINILDKREILLLMSLYYDVYKKNRLSFKEVLSQKDEFSCFVSSFLKRDEQDKSLESMGFILTKDKDNNPIYIRM